MVFTIAVYDPSPLSLSHSPSLPTGAARFSKAHLSNPDEENPSLSLLVSRRRTLTIRHIVNRKL